MALFKKKAEQKPEPVQKYSEIEQGAVPEPPVEPFSELATQIAKVLENQKVIVSNQQIILNGVTKTQGMIQFFATGAQEEPEPTEEELKAAALELRKKRGA